MSHVRSTVRDIPDEQLSIRPGGLYWVTVDRTGDAEILAAQALMALPAQQRVPLVWRSLRHGGDIAAVARSWPQDFARTTATIGRWR